MSATMQYTLGFLLFVVANASAQGMIPDTDGGRWLILISTSLTLWLQRLGINTQHPKPQQEQPPPVDPGGGRNSGPNPGGGKPPKQHEAPPPVDPGGG